MSKFVYCLLALALAGRYADACCPANEVFSLCGNNGCQNTCANPNIAKTCKDDCIQGCICISGYLRNTAGVCVPAKKCDTCGNNEVFDLCGNTECVNTCDEPCRNRTCTPVGGCNAGCICRKGYLRNEQNVCVKKKKCGCGGDPNAIFDKLGDTCPTTCDNIGLARVCVAVLPKEGGCKCKKGYVRDHKQKCIKPEQCNRCEGPNEYFGCGSACDTTCATLGETCPIINIKCTEKCYCKDGFARDDDGVCIPIDQCPSKECPSDPNAIVTPCGDPCPLTCENKDSPVIRPCIALCIINGCKCKEGYVQDASGKCIIATECPAVIETYSTCPDNEIQTECRSNRCDITCANPHISANCTATSIPGCSCIEGYLRNTNGVCVPACECDTCEENEIFDLCGNTGCVNTCLAPDLSTRCRPDGCRAGCICKEGYLRNDKQKCVLPEQCGSMCGGDPYAVFDPQGDPCPKTCENKDADIRICPDYLPTEEGCRCIEGFVKDYKGKCIRPSECQTCDGPNEIFRCGSACDATCTTLGEKCPIVNRKCIEKCYCRNGFARDVEGVCIAIDQCPPKICKHDPNAIIVPCGDPCPLTCENMHSPLTSVCHVTCIVDGCKCKEGYVIGSDGKCVLAKNCPIKCKANEIFSECGNNACQNTCANPTISKYCRPVCTSGCICVEGYLKNSQGECVPPYECDSCRHNEVFDLCGGTSCVNTCAEPDKTTRCKPSGCSPGCICKDGLLRNTKFKCVEPVQCDTGCGGDLNAMYDRCGDPCPVTCLNRDKPSNCTADCNNIGSCKCKPGFVRDENGKCITPDQCPKCTGKHEVFACGSPCDTTCDTLGEECNIITAECVDMCYCEEGYARNDEGECIRIELCPPKHCNGDPNAYSAPCGDPCPLTCRNKDNPPPCIEICIPDGCKCKEGYVLNKRGKCILESECPVYPQCKENEVYSKCRNNDCQNTCMEPNKALYCDPECVPGCVCIEGYLRNTKGSCVPALECDTCRENEIFDLYNNTRCANTCDEPDLSTRCKPRKFYAGCICKEGYLRNHKYKCVKPEECFAKSECNGDPNAYYDPRGDPCPVTCENKDDVINCSISCSTEGGCKCKSGYVRNLHGKCIKPEECPKCSGDNEFFACGSACDTTCETLGEPCPIVNIKCTEMCYCKEGFARDEDGVCILVNECPKQCKDDPNAIVLPCGDPCPITCENKDDPNPRPCPRICIPDGCKCKTGYVLDKNGKCILPEDCPSIPVCRTNEEYVECPPSCPPEVTCSTYFTGYVPLCPVSSENQNCTPSCRCKAGYIRSESGRCILPEKCCKDPYSELVSCPNPCPGGTCDAIEFSPCRRKCDSYGCQCKQGFVKISDSEPYCVPVKYCSYFLEELKRNCTNIE